MFGLNNAQLPPWRRCHHRHLTNGGRVANVSIATTSPITRGTCGPHRVDRIVTFRGLGGLMEKHAKKGRLVYVSGKLQTRKWRKDGEDATGSRPRSCGPRRQGAISRRATYA